MSLLCSKSTVVRRTHVAPSLRSASQQSSSKTGSNRLGGRAIAMTSPSSKKGLQLRHQLEETFKGQPVCFQEGMDSASAIWAGGMGPPPSHRNQDRGTCTQDVFDTFSDTQFKVVICSNSYLQHGSFCGRFNPNEGDETELDFDFISTNNSPESGAPSLQSMTLALKGTGHNQKIVLSYNYRNARGREKTQKWAAQFFTSTLGKNQYVIVTKHPFIKKTALVLTQDPKKTDP